jgi:germination protein M
MASKSRHRSGFLFMFVVIVLLVAVIYTFKDRLSVLFNTGYSAGKNFIGKNFDKKNDVNLAKKKIETLDKKNNNKEDDKIKDNIDSIKENLKEIKDKLSQNQAKSEASEKIVKKSEKDNDSSSNANDKIKTNNDKKSTVAVENSKKDTEKQTKEKKALNQRTSKIYFSRINSSDKLMLVSVDRNVSYKDTPLTETISSLLKGPSENEKTKEVITNIPHNSKLISVSIKDNTAYVNFSKDFEYNTYGKDATVIQIKQIVYTATEFPNIKSVQILIDGKVIKYLGGEGVMINKPLSRSDFS